MSMRFAETMQAPVWASRLGGPGEAGCSVPTERAASTSGRVRGAHVVHAYSVLTFVTEGRVEVEQLPLGRAWGRGPRVPRYEAREGSVVVVPAGARHGRLGASAGDAWGVGFHASCFASGELAPLLAPFERVARGGSPVVPIPAARRGFLASLCAELGRETGEGRQLHGALVARELFALILAEVSRASAELPPAAPATDSLVADVLAHIERRCLGPLPLAELAELVHRSPSHTSAEVRRVTGRSITEWITEGRMAEARRRLLATDEHVDVIAERVGYADATHFIRVFRRAHGQTPSAFRRSRGELEEGVHDRGARVRAGRGAGDRGLHR